MMTDGVYDSLNDKMNEKELQQYMSYLQHSGKDANTIAKHILKMALGEENPFDDMSVLCMYLNETDAFKTKINLKNKMAYMLHKDKTRREYVKDNNLDMN